MSASSTFRNRGVIETSGFSNATAIITLNHASAIYIESGELISTSASASISLIKKTLGTLKILPSAKLKVGNSLSPINCTANTSASKDIYMFGCITNCNGTTYGLAFSFDGSSYAPNDLVGGVKYENIAY